MTERIEPTRKSEAQILLFRLAMYGREEIEITAPWQTDREINYICARCRRFHGNRSSVFCYRLRSFTWCGWCPGVSGQRFLCQCTRLLFASGYTPCEIYIAAII